MSHIVEPKRPIKALAPNNYPYPKGANKVKDCGSGLEEYPWGDFVRTEPVLTIEPVWPDKAAPSEHYTVLYELLVTATVIQPDGREVTRLFKREGGFWQHQNVAPHTPGPKEIVQWNAWLLPNGPVQFNWTVRGDESGKELVANCAFVITGSPVKPYVIDLRTASPAEVSAMEKQSRPLPAGFKG